MKQNKFKDNTMLGLPSQRDILNAINSYQKKGGEENNLSQLLSFIRHSYKGEDLFSTFSLKPDESFRTVIENNFTIKSAGHSRLTDKHLSLVTRGEALCSYQYSIGRVNNSFVAHFLVRLKSNVLNNFYVKVTDRSNNLVEHLRFSNDNMTFGGDLGYHLINNRDFHLFTLSIDESFIKTYVDGLLIRRKNRVSKKELHKLIFELVGNKGSDLEASIYGIEIWSVANSINSLIHDEDSILKEIFDTLLRKGDLHGIYRHLCFQNIDGLTLNSVQQDECLNLLKSHIQNGKKGFKDWMISGIIGCLPEESRSYWNKWFDKCSIKPIIEVDNLTVEFSRNPSEAFTLKKIVGIEKDVKFEVFENLLFKIYPGDILGVIGQNGVGKSTLLRTLVGLIPIKSGRILLKGNFILLKAGVGTRPELTGRENIYHAGAYLGLSGKELAGIIDDVIAFSELGEAIDRPLKYYSDGMRARLIFSLATSINPEILMLDELLGAGDIGFREKAIARLNRFIENAKAVIVVTHNLSFVRNRCNKALFLSKQRGYYFGDPEVAIARYLDEIHLKDRLNTSIDVHDLSSSEHCIVDD